MLIRICRFLTIVLTALSMGLSVCHLLEMPVRLNFEPELWVRITVFEGIFRYFGSIGALFEVGSVLMAIVLIFLVWKRGSTVFYSTLGGALSLVLALALWVVIVASANAELARWLVNPIPPDFESWRNQWEYGHAANASIKIIGFCLLLFSVVAETPDKVVADEAERTKYYGAD